MPRQSYAQILTRQHRHPAPTDELARHLPEHLRAATAPASLGRYLANVLGAAARLAADHEDDTLAWLSIAEIRRSLNLDVNADTTRALEPLYRYAALPTRELYARIRSDLERLVRAGLVDRAGLDEPPRDDELVYRLAP